jgi:hypothetical protein
MAGQQVGEYANLALADIASMDPILPPTSEPAYAATATAPALSLRRRPL